MIKNARFYMGLRRRSYKRHLMNLQEQSVIFNCERDSQDPRIAHELVLETDQYGNVLQSAKVVYPRKHILGLLPQKVKDEQAKMHIQCTKNIFTEDAIDDSNYTYYRLRVPYEAQSFEANFAVPTGQLFSISELRDYLDNAAETDYTQSPTLNEIRLLSHSKMKFYNDTATSQLLFGQLESLAIPYESYTLAFTPDIVSNCYDGRVSNGILDEGGYLDVQTDGRYWLPSGKAVYDNPTTKFYTPESFIDPWGGATQIEYWDTSYFLPKKTTDALGNIAEVLGYDWNSLQLTRTKDANDNISEIRYDALGMPAAMALKGKDNGTEGDSLADLDIDSAADKLLQEDFWGDPESAAADLLQGATWRCIYDLNASPTAVAMIARTEHLHPTVLTAVEPLIRISYSDGFGRILMHKAQCEPTLENGNKEWIGSGRTIYNNKGKEVMQYEPYFSTTHYCDTAEQADNQGVSPKLFYDPLGRVNKTELPDGSFSKTEWTTWQQKIWDNNDTVLDSEWYTDRIGGAMGLEEKDAAIKAAAHADTPTIMHTDTLAKGFFTVQNDGINPLIESYETLDIQGNRLSVTDGRGIVPLQYGYNMLQAPCLQISVDSGTQRTLLDVAGQPLYAWDADDRKTEIIYDELRRPLQKKVTESSATKTLEITVYGEGQTDDKVKNLRGQLYQHKDGGGLQQINSYDFKGNALQTQQQLLNVATLSDVDWGASPVLATETFTGSVTYDALNRPVSQTDPGSNVQAFTYDKGGYLKTVELNGDNYVQDIHHDAKGQRSAIWYGNGTKTSYTYDEFTFRLRRLLTVNLNTNDQLQDLNYWYDPIGNITEIQDDAQQTLFFNNSVVLPTQMFIYDALYRLTEVKGRELIGLASFGAEDNWNDAAWQTSHKGDGNAVQNYTQKYTYDEVGNILELQHIAGSASYTRTYDLDINSNRLFSTRVGTDVYDYTYDLRGNMMAMPHLSDMLWNTQNELKQITRGSDATYYQYSGGQRVRKYTDKSTVKEERIYLGNYELYRKFDSSGNIDIERSTVHVSDDTGRIAMLEMLNPNYGSDGSEPVLTRYIYSNHLQSASLELDEDGEIISYEEYHPYGTTAYQAINASINAVAKRYRYTGKERDEESGLYYHGARYYAPWLVRWTAVDPLEHKYVGMSPYNYGFNNPIVWSDPSGMSPDLPETSKNKYGEKQVYIDKGNYVDNGFGGVTRDEKKVTPSGTAVSKGMSELDLYRFAIDRVLNPGERIVKDDRYLDEKYFAIEGKVKEFVNLRLLVGSMPDTKEYRKQTAEFKDKAILSVLFNDENAQGNLAQIKRSTSFGGRNNFVYEGGKLLAMGLASGIAKATAREMTGKLFSNILKEETTSQTDKYVKLLTEFGEYDATKILYRGTSGSEKAGAQIFFTDNSAAAATYVKNGGQLIETRVSQFGLKKLELEGKLEILQDLHKGVRHTSYKFQGAELREAMMRITKPFK